MDPQRSINFHQAGVRTAETSIGRYACPSYLLPWMEWVYEERGISALRLDHTIARHSELIYNSADILPGWRTLFTAAWARPIQSGGPYTCGRSLETLRESPRKFWYSYRSRGWWGLDNMRVHTFTSRGAPHYQNSTCMVCMYLPPWPLDS